MSPKTPFVILCLGIYGALAMWSTSHRDFWRDEPENALVIRDTQATSTTPTDWLIPRAAGRPYLVDPPLFYWLSAMSSYLATTLKPTLGYRLPGVAFALLSLWLTFYLGAHLFDRRIGFLGMAIHATTLLFFFNVGWLGPKLPFAIFCQLSLTGMVLGAEKSAGNFWKVVAWTGLAAASLTVSIVGAVLLVTGPLVLFFFLGGGVPELKRALRKLTRGGLWLLFPLLTAPWYIYAAIRHGRAFVDQHVGEGHLAQFYDSNVTAYPLLYYLYVLIIGFLPWSLFVPVGILLGRDRTSRPGQRLCLCWFLLTLIGLSVVPSKHAAYLLFCWPPIALLIPAAFLETGQKFSVWEDYLGSGVARALPFLLKAPLLAVAVASVLWFSGLYKSWVNPLLLEPLQRQSVVLPLLALSAVGAVGAFLVSSRVKVWVKKGELGGAAFETARATLFLLFLCGFLSHLLEPLESARPFLTRVKKRVGSATLSTYGATRSLVIDYYLEQPHGHLEELNPQAERDSGKDRPRQLLVDYLEPTDRVYVLASRPAFDALRFQYPGIKALLHETGIAGFLGSEKEYVLLSNSR